MAEKKFRARKATGEWAHFTLDEVLKHSTTVPAWVYEYPSITKDRYTGLKDKNGRAIYEGDIVILGRLPKDDIFEVEFEDGSFNAVGQHDSHTLGFIKSWEVIGNIYENPELLEKAA